jgi:hypothetical protein
LFWKKPETTGKNPPKRKNDNTKFSKLQTDYFVQIAYYRTKVFTHLFGILGKIFDNRGQWEKMSKKCFKKYFGKFYKYITFRKNWSWLHQAECLDDIQIELDTILS